MACIKKKKKVESFSFEDRIVPVRHMTCVSLSEFTVIWIDHIHKRNTDSLGARWNFRYLLLHPVAAVSSAWSAGAVMMKCVLFIVLQQTTPNAYYLLVCVSQDSGAAVGPGMVYFLARSEIENIFSFELNKDLKSTFELKEYFDSKWVSKIHVESRT